MIPDDAVTRAAALIREGHGHLSPETIARQILALLPAQEGWRPIETAPKDGRKALVYRPRALLSGDEPVDVKRLIGGNHHCWDCTVPPGQKPTNPTNGACHVTHWMPIPARPALVADNHGENKGA